MIRDLVQSRLTQISFLCFLITILSNACKQEHKEEEPEVYMFSFFQNNGEDGLHLAYSEDGYNWTVLNNNESYLTPTVSQDKLMRDPCIIKGADGKFHMVWTVSWQDKGIGYASSEDLINWSEQKFIPVMAHEPEARNCWAPELFYDETSKEYMIYWATTIPGRFAETDSTGDDKYNHRMYYTTTKDFDTFSDTELLYDKGFNVIDATIQKIDGKYVMFLKDETKFPEPEKNIRIVTSNELTGNYSQASEPISVNWVEGPTSIKLPEGWVVYFDKYTNHNMGAIISTDLKNWEDISDKVHFPDGTRHGTVFKVKKSVLVNLKKASDS
ncbi:glycoside hydrolase family 43 protein [Chondrinema litorale]|uniref:glycoside hydrolase family 43 protein n=1 Tax=Chondrinema litorale TaxID=2994555 RepID=UPI00254312C4|nr:glycoside hydrolase family 43 protein [Chondrinema litorale]UZR96081.1 glycoside hydrolase family 43 protein [Chondrinema litorale]